MHLPKGTRLTVAVAALGYFVDIYDLLLFSIVRKGSLLGLGVPESELLSSGVFLINAQMAGLLLGGILWGVLGDRKGRLSVLFGSILLYSVANIANAFVHSVEMYGVWRFIAGIGLAGELGAAITLVSEILPRETRGVGTTIVAAVGILGAVLAAILGETLDWRTAYIVGGVMGLGLLLLRFKMLESGMYAQTERAEVSRGNFWMLFRSRDRFGRYLSCILIGVPIWFVIGILITFSPELARAAGVSGEVSSGRAVMFCYIGLSAGDLISGLVSQWMRSRKRVVGIFLVLTAVLVSIYCFVPGLSLAQFYILCGCLGVSVGYWAVFVTTAAEQFGTNLRATVATTTPNFVRGSVVLLTTLTQALQPRMGLLQGAYAVGVVSIGIAFFALSHLRETFGRDLDFVERE